MLINALFKIYYVKGFIKMAKAHKGLDSLTKYLRFQYAWKENFVCEYLKMEFTYDEVKAAMKKLKTTDPKLHRIRATRSAES